MSYHPLDLDRDLRTQRRDIRHAQRTRTDLNRLWRRERRRMFRRSGRRMPNVLTRRRDVVGYRVTGRLIVDDPSTATEAMTAERRADVLRWYTDTIPFSKGIDP